MNTTKILLGTVAASMLLAAPAFADCVVTRPDGKSVFVTGTCTHNLAPAPQPTRATPYQPAYYGYGYGYQGYQGYQTPAQYSRYHVRPDYYRLSASSDNIAAVQTKLVRLGFWVGPEGVNGVRGSDTIQAIKDFQRHHGLKADGVVGEKTAYKLNERTANYDYSNRWVRSPDYASGYYR